MAELELNRTPDDRRVYALEGVGTLRLEGLASRTATAEAGGSSWRITRHGLGAIEPGLLQFAAFVVRGLAEDAGGAAATAGSGT
jgi:hypothetical protein